MITNDVTGDRLVTKPVTEDYRDNYDRIFSKNKVCRKDIKHNKILDEAELEYLSEKCVCSCEMGDTNSCSN